MKLIFSKSKDNEFSVKLATGTVVEDFTYTSMLKQLLKKNKFEDCQFNGLTTEEKRKIEDMLQKINEAVDEKDD